MTFPCTIRCTLISANSTSAVVDVQAIDAAGNLMMDLGNQTLSVGQGVCVTGLSCEVTVTATAAPCAGPQAAKRK